MSEYDDSTMGETVAQDRLPLYPPGGTMDTLMRQFPLTTYGGMAQTPQRDFGDMGDTSRTMAYSPLDAKSLIDSGAIRIVQHPDGNKDDPNSFAIVTHYNDMYPDSYTRDWPNKPASYAAAQQTLANPNSGALYDGKYRQILWSMQQKGMRR